jgi:hypothetical protein
LNITIVATRPGRDLIDTAGSCQRQELWMAAIRHIIKVAALAMLPLVSGDHTPATENDGKVITLSCDGTLTRTYGANKPADPEPLQKTGVVVNLDEQTVFFLGYVVPIENVDEVSIYFGARQIVDYGFSIGITGHIDRASGRMDVTTMTLDPTKPDDPGIATLRYDVVCKATNSGL